MHTLNRSMLCRLIAAAVVLAILTSISMVASPGSADAAQPPAPSDKPVVPTDEPPKTKDEKPPKPAPQTGDDTEAEKLKTAASKGGANAPNRDIGPLLSKLYRPVEAGLKGVDFDFRHQAFENAAFPFRSARFHGSFRAPDEWKLTVSGLHEAHKTMASRLVEIMDWVGSVTGGLAILDEQLDPERVVRVQETDALTTVTCRGKKGQTPWQLRFREVDGKMRLHTIDSPDFGRVLLRYETVDDIAVVTALDIDDPLSALGKWTLRCENLVVNPK